MKQYECELRVGITVTGENREDAEANALEIVENALSKDGAFVYVEDVTEKGG